jgi:hypothetical protein
MVMWICSATCITAGEWSAALVGRFRPPNQGSTTLTFAPKISCCRGICIKIIKGQPRFPAEVATEMTAGPLRLARPLLHTNMHNSLHTDPRTRGNILRGAEINTWCRNPLFPSYLQPVPPLAHAGCAEPCGGPSGAYAAHIE